MISTSRIRGILLNPRQEWPVIAAEPTTPAALYTGWIVPLAAIGPIAGFIGFSTFGLSLPFMGRYRPPITSLLAGAIVRYARALAGVAVVVFAAISSLLLRTGRYPL